MRFAALLIALFASHPARADDSDCWNSDHSIYNCDEGGGGAVGASAPLIGDTLESNPAALPTSPTPFGLETMWSDRSAPAGKKKFSVSTIKGFEGIGFGIGAWSDGTFSAPDFPAHFLSSSALAEYKEYERNPPSVIGIRLGTTVVLPKFLFPKFMRVSVGGSAGLGRVTGEVAPQVGALASIYGLGVGYSESFERLSKALPKTRISNFAVGFPLGPLYLGYTYAVIRSSVNRTFANLYGIRFTSGGWTLHGGWKSQKDHRGAMDAWSSAGLRRQLGKRFGLGYEYGYYRYSHSAVLQIFL